MSPQRDPDVRTTVNRFAPFAAGLIVTALAVIAVVAATHPVETATPRSFTIAEAQLVLPDTSETEAAVTFDGQTGVVSSDDVTPRAIPSSVSDGCLGMFWLRPGFERQVAVQSFASSTDELRLVVAVVEVMPTPATALARYHAALEVLDRCPSVDYRSVDATGQLTFAQTATTDATSAGLARYAMDYSLDFDSGGTSYHRTGVEKVYLVGNLIYHVGYQTDAGAADTGWGDDFIDRQQQRIDELVAS